MVTISTTGHCDSIAMVTSGEKRQNQHQELKETDRRRVQVEMDQTDH